MPPEQTYRDGIRAVIDTFPPFSRAQLDQLAAILAPVLANQAAGRRPRDRGNRAA
jgi:hypothetical protein